MTCPYCPDKKYYNAEGWHRHMREKHNHAPWYSGEVRGSVQAASAPLTVELDTAHPLAPASVPEEPEPLGDTLPHVETLQNDDYAFPEEETADPSKPRPQTLSTEDIEKFNAPGDVCQAAQAIVASAIPDDPELYPAAQPRVYTTPLGVRACSTSPLLWPGPIPGNSSPSWSPSLVKGLM